MILQNAIRWCCSWGAGRLSYRKELLELISIKKVDTKVEKLVDLLFYIRPGHDYGVVGWSLG